MRSKEQFKAYVYDKADAARAKNKKIRAIALRGAAAFSLMLIVGGAWLHSRIPDFAMAPETILEEEALQNVSAMHAAGLAAADAQSLDDGAIAETVSSYGYVADVTLDSYSLTMADLYSDSAARSEKLCYSASEREFGYTVAESAAAYHGDLENIDFDKNVAVVFDGDTIAPTEIENCTIEYAEDVIVIRIALSETNAENGISAEATYTLLLDKKRYNGQPIEVIFE